MRIIENRIKDLRENKKLDVTEMVRAKDLTYKDIVVAMDERGTRVLHRFGQAATFGVNDPKLLSVLEDVKIYWKDTFRPALASFCCEAVGGKPNATDDVSLMITLASAGGGIHDDILDRSLNKHFRKQMTVFGRHGSDKALLVGDLLILKGWTMVENVVKKNFEPKKIAGIIAAFGNWTVEVCEAEFMEVLCRQNLEIELEYYQKMLWESMADIEACARLGGILGDGSDEEVEALAEYGRRLGFMFRLVEDVKDVLNVAGSLSKRLENESVPLPILYAAKSSRELYFKIKLIIKESPIAPSGIKVLIESCFEAEAFAYVIDIAQQNAKKATEKLDLLKPSVARQTLLLMLEKILADLSDLCPK